MWLDEWVLLVFIFFGGDGFKVMFCMEECCFDFGFYSYFYKVFLYKLIQQYDLGKVVDLVMYDVFCVCFLSVDNEVYFNLGVLFVCFFQYFDVFVLDVICEVYVIQKELEKE